MFRLEGQNNDISLSRIVINTPQDAADEKKALSPLNKRVTNNTIKELLNQYKSNLRAQEKRLKLQNSCNCLKGCGEGCGWFCGHLFEKCGIYAGFVVVILLYPVIEAIKNKDSESEWLLGGSAAAILFFTAILDYNYLPKDTFLNPEESNTLATIDTKNHIIRKSIRFLEVAEESKLFHKDEAHEAPTQILNHILEYMDSEDAMRPSP